MLIDQQPQQYVETVECTKITKFNNLVDATMFAKIKGYMVIKEQGQSIWYTMPNVNGVLTGGCYENF